MIFSLYFKFVFPQQAEEENEQRKKQEQALMEKLLEQEALMEQQDPKVRSVCFSDGSERSKSREGYDEFASLKPWSPLSTGM